MKRHEREALLQGAALNQKRWESDRYRATIIADKRNNRDFSSSNRWTRRRPAGTSSEDLNSRYGATRALTSAFRESISESVFPSSDPPSSPRSIQSQSSDLLYPSPTFQFPSSGRTTPLVPLDSTRAVLPGLGFTLDQSSELI